MRRTSLTFLSFPMLVAAAALASQAGCQVKYRRDVEKSGTEARYTHSAGGYIRYDGYDDVAGDLEIASKDFVKPGSGTRVRLVGVIHIGDLEYYRTLQAETLDTSDVVLFEGVKFEGQDPENVPEIGKVYGAIGGLLGIGFQKDGIDYGAENFVHCDVTVREGDPLFQTIDPEQVKQAGQLMQPLVMAKNVLGLGSEPRRIEDALKHGMVTMMTMQMAGMDGRDAAEEAAERLGGDGDPQMRERAKSAAEALRKALPKGEIPGFSEEMQREILVRRNDYVMEQLKARLEADGADKKQTVAIFYGAAHMPGMEKELRSWGYEPAETVWFKAWRMNGAGQPILAERLNGDGVRGAGRREPEASGVGAKQPEPGRRARRRDPVLF